MGYTCFELRFKARSPIFIGSQKIGFIQQTRRYIPGKTMWGAITANVTRKLIEQGVKYNPKVYEDVGKCIKDSVKNTYFFPEILSNEDETNQCIFNPIFSKEGLKYGSYSEREFESVFISSFVSTATIGSRNSAMDESLHETEYILNKVILDYNYKNESNSNQPYYEPKQVYWKGYIFLKDDDSRKCSVKNSGKFEDVEVGYEDKSIKLFDAIKEIHVGGDLRYGFGTLELSKDKVLRKNENSPVFDWYLESTEDHLIFNKDYSREASPIFGHLLLNSNESIRNTDESLKYKYRGELEPLVGRKYDNNKGFGRLLDSNGVAFVPGTCFGDEINKIELGSCGLLKFSSL
ncbi:MAG: RAMP superfamily CRISPR-associated protein [Methanobacterium sp.]